MLGVGDNQLSRPIGRQVAQVMQGAREDLVAIGRMAAVRAPLVLEGALAADDLRLRQVFDTGDALGWVGPIAARSGHRDVLPEGLHPSGASIGLDTRLKSLCPGNGATVSMLWSFRFVGPWRRLSRRCVERTEQQGGEERAGGFHGFDVPALNGNERKTFPTAWMRSSFGWPSEPRVGWSQPPSSCSFHA